MTNYILFWRPTDPNGWLGNWHKSSFTINNITYNCVEQWIMVNKARLFNDQLHEKKIMDTGNPRTHKYYGRRVTDFDPFIWEEHKEKILYKGLFAKFSQNDKLKQKLLDTGDAILAEASPYDNIYGIGLKFDNPKALNPKNWKGQNLLGNTLMKIRDVIRQNSGKNEE